MKWQQKALAQKIMSRLPFAGRLNYFLQRYVNRSLPMGEAVFIQKQEAAKKHLQAFEGHDGKLKENAIAYEFGAGYDLAVPIALWEEGLKKQVVTDINPLLKWKLVNDMLDRRGNDVQVNNSRDLEQKTGIKYLTRIDTRSTGFDAGSFDYIYSTDTLEHIPDAYILPILQECYRLLKPGGLISCMIDLQDHYAYFDKNISPFNFYSFDKNEWELKYNNRLQYQNRLLAGEYYSLFARAGFAPIQMHLAKATGEEIAKLKKLQLHTDFAGKAIEELNNLRCHIVAERPD